MLRRLLQATTDPTHSNGWAHMSHTNTANWQLVSDCLIAIAYFSIPLELVYFLIKSQILPYRWVIAMFGTFIVLCGITHLLTLWHYFANSEAATIGMSVAKVVTATVSCCTAIALLWVIPELLDVKRREEFFTQKTAELGVEVGNIRKDHQVMKHVRMLTDEIRSTLDRHKILGTTMVELTRTLGLGNCDVWLPKKSAKQLELVHRVGSQETSAAAELEMSSTLVQMVFSSNHAVLVPTSPGGSGAPAVAIRIPLLCSGDSCEDPSYALMMLSFPASSPKPWTAHDLELIEAVADQVAVALSHASVVEETLRNEQQLIQQNIDLQQAKKEAECAVHARNEFLVVMNHEMRTPLHAIVALSSLLLEGPNLKPDERSMIETICKSGGLLSTLINDILDFAKLEAGSLSLDLHPFSLPKLLDDAERLLAPLAQAKNLPFELKRMGEIPKDVKGDSTRVLQIMLNVVGNAIKFTASGHVHVSVCSTPRPLSSRSDDFILHVEVEDTGIGIRPSDIPRLFNKFVQADSSTSRKFGGSGLGLAICKKFTEYMGGCISIESEGLGKGSTCRFQIVLTRVKARAETQAGSAATTVNLAKINVLAVDDNAVNRTVIRRLLTNIGCKFSVVDSGQSCLDVLSSEGPSTYTVILLDLCMPEMDGYEVAEEVMKRYPERPLIVALTANSDMATTTRCLDLGMDAVLTKPVSLVAMKAELTKLLLAKKVSIS